LFLATCISVNGADENSTTLPQQYSVKVVSFLDGNAEEKGLTVGLANVKNHVCTDDGCNGSINLNKEKVLRVIDQLKEYKVNMILFPEFSLTGYFWGFDDVSNSKKGHYNSKKTSPDCWNYMNEGVLDLHLDWLKVVQSKLDGSLKYIIFNSIRNGPRKGNATQLDNKFLNSTYVIDENFNCDNLSANEETHIYDKTFLPGIEKLYTITGQRDFLIIKTDWGNFGFTTCYDMCFSQLYQEYDLAHKIDGIIQLASWRGPALRRYNITPKPIVNQNYYGFQWDLMASDRAATNQVWLLPMRWDIKRKVGTTFGETLVYGHHQEYV
jgi:predicted amidohydrolase